MNDQLDDRLLGELRGAGRTVITLSRRPGDRSIRHLLALLAIVRKYDAAIIHTHTHGTRIWALLLKMFRPHLKLVHSVHTLGQTRTHGRLVRSIYKLGVSRFVAVSKAAAEECRGAGFANVDQIENGVELEQFTPLQRPQRATRLRLVNVARFQPSVKGQDLLIQALAMCRANGLDVECALVGPHAPPASLYRLVEALGLADCVEFVIDPQDVSRHLHAADIFVLPSRSEAFGLALLEAMAAGLPVIASRVGGPAELIEDGRNGLLFEPGNVADLAAAIERVAADPDLRNRLAVESEKTAQHFSIDRMAARYHALYTCLLRKGTSTRFFSGLRVERVDDESSSRRKDPATDPGGEH